MIWYGISFQISSPQYSSMHCNSAMNSWPVICRMFQVVVINTVNLLQTRSQKNVNKIMEKLWYDWTQTWICSTYGSFLLWIEINVLIAIESVDTFPPSSCNIAVETNIRTCWEMVEIFAVFGLEVAPYVVLPHTAFTEEGQKWAHIP